ncbi:MAG: hypothetical protein H6686_10400 [Fibrobacteria bacterium]|nr:hypothetical protein [Fibrobacteria bacterium]
MCLLALCLSVTGVIHAESATETDPWGWSLETDALPFLQDTTDPSWEQHGYLRARARPVDGDRAIPRELAAGMSMGPGKLDAAIHCDTTCRSNRQALEVHHGEFALAAGDLSPWKEEPLLEGSRESSPGSGTFLDALGSGKGPSGLDGQIGAPDADLRVRARLAGLGQAGFRGSGYAEWKGIRTGLVFAETDRTRLHPFVGWTRATRRSSLGISILGYTGQAWDIHLALDGEHERLGVRVANSVPGFPHGGMPRSRRGATSGNVEFLARRGSYRFLTHADVEMDSIGRESWDLSPELEFHRSGFSFRCRGRLHQSATGSDAPLLQATPGLRRTRGRIRPWIEVPWDSRRRWSLAAGARATVGRADFQVSWHFVTWEESSWETKTAMGGGHLPRMEIVIQAREDVLRAGTSIRLDW